LKSNPQKHSCAADKTVQGKMTLVTL